MSPWNTLIQASIVTCIPFSGVHRGRCLGNPGVSSLLIHDQVLSIDSQKTLKSAPSSHPPGSGRFPLDCIVFCLKKFLKVAGPLPFRFVLTLTKNGFPKEHKAGKANPHQVTFSAEWSHSPLHKKPWPGQFPIACRIIGAAPASAPHQPCWRWLPQRWNCV